MGQDHLSMSGPLGGGTSSLDGGLNQDLLIVGSPTGVLVGSTKFTDCSGERKIKVLRIRDKISEGG